MKQNATMLLNHRICICLLLMGSLLKSQDKKWLEADELMEIKNYPAALSIYEELNKIEPINGALNLKIAMCKYYLRHPSPGIYPYLIRAKQANQLEALYYLGLLYHTDQRFEEEINSYQHYRNSSGIKKVNDAEIVRRIAIAKRALETLEKPAQYTIQNLGPKLNSKYSEYIPVLSVDEKTLIFTSGRPGSTGDKKDEYGNYFEDLYVSKYKDKEWKEPVNLGPPINTETHDACVSLSADGNSLIIYRKGDKKNSGDLYISSKQENTWGDPEKLPMQINSEEYVEPSASMTADNQTIYFSSNRPGGMGGKDIYRVVKLPDGKWSAPMNIGPTINTEYDEDAPYIHPDGMTLFFSSNGHSTIGGYDIFRSDMQFDGLWTEPDNLGAPVNTVGDDIFFVLSVDGKNGYFSSDRAGGYGEKDIYKVDINYNVPSMKVISGFVYDSKNKQAPVHASIRLIDETNHIVPHAVYTTNNKTGKFIAICNPKAKYRLIFEAEGYHPSLSDIDPMQLGVDDGSVVVHLVKK